MPTKTRISLTLAQYYYIILRSVPRVDILRPGAKEKNQRPLPTEHVGGDLFRKETVGFIVMSNFFVNIF